MTIKLALIGCGGIARRHVLSMKELQERGRGDFVVIAVCDANEANALEKADMFEELFGVRPTVYADHQTLITKAGVDAVDMCLPHGLHHSIAVDCMEGGLDVLCEKPLGITIKACRQMIDAAERTGKVLSTAAPHRRQPGQRVAHWIFNESKLIGEPQSFFHTYRRPPAVPTTSNEPVPDRVRWRQDKLMSGGGPVLDSGFHYCDSIRYFFGDVDKVYAELRSLKTGVALPFTEAPEDTVMVTFTFKSGVVGNWSWSLAAPGEEAYNVTFYGSEGSLRDTTAGRFSIFHLFERRPEQKETALLTQKDGTTYSMEELEARHRATLNDEQRELFYPGGTTDGFSIEIWEFLEILRGNIEKPEIDGWEGLRSLAIGDAIYESALTGEVIQVDDVVSGARGSFQAPIDEHWGL
ncbi:MAG TPA: Gfo/Idh/MocA family oxidoreductase [Caldilineaceae bacterium]|nr:Gfo/Idh/MocA family oxidoreductase [Caldilineaceae bacterium]